jgi:hypothetical protein
VVNHQPPALLTAAGASDDGQCVVDHPQVAALSQAAAAADRAASSVRFAEYRRWLAACLLGA